MIPKDSGGIFENKYKEYGDLLYRICMMYLKNHSNVEDAIQEAFIKLIYKAPDFNTKEDELRWLIRIAINICKDNLKSYWHKNIVSIDVCEEISINQETNDVFQMIRDLPEKYKSVIYLYYTEGFSIDEISKILKISISAVKMRMKRGKEMLRVKLEGER